MLSYSDNDIIKLHQVQL